MRKALAILAGVLVLSLANYAIHTREAILRDGSVVRLRLAPVDPRSLMQGDYMALRFEVADEAFGWRPGGTDESADGYVVLGLDARRVGHFERLYAGGGLAANEIRIRYRIRRGVPRFATNAYFFQEGEMARYAQARYGEFRVSEGGEAILVEMLDEDLQALDQETRG